MKALSIAVMFLGILVFSWGSPRYAFYLGSNRPKSPDPSHGLILERKFKGGTSVFISRNDMYMETSIDLLGMALFVAGALAFRRDSSTGEA
jgi:hypothetical protein